MRKNARKASTQQNKGRTVKVVKSGNPDYVRAMQGLRGSSAASPHKSAKAYTRKTRDNQIPEA